MITAMTERMRILELNEQGEPAAVDQLLPLFYDELQMLARRTLGQERPGLTLDPTGLVHEAYLRLVGGQRIIAALDKNQKSQASLAVDSPERFNWHRIPRERQGLPRTGTRSRRWLKTT
jgi:hypothetical protein